VSGVRFQPSSGRGGSVGSRIFATVFCAVFAVVGVAITGVITKQFLRDAQTHRWPVVPCVILESGVTDKGGSSPYVPTVHYQYESQGRTFNSQQFATQPKSFSDYAKAQRLVDKFRADTKSTCYVNPQQPTDAILQRASLATGFLIFFPMIFVVLGLGGIYLVWRARTPAAPAPISLKPEVVTGRKFAVGFFSIFLLVGLAAFYAVFIRPAIKTLQARDWNPVPCTIVSSRVQHHSSDDGTTYSVDILYTYEVDGHEYKANRYHFMGGSSSGYKGKQRIVHQHPPGAKKICYVNPNDPMDAVLQRGFSPVMFFGLIPLVFVIVGLGGIIRTLRKTPVADSRRGELRRAPNQSAAHQQHVVLKPQASPVTKFVGGLLVSIFWNGIVSVFVFQIIQMWRTGDGMKWFLTLFMIPFVLIGLGMIVFTIHSFFGLFSPRVRLRLAHSPLTLGESVELSWEFSGRVDKLRDIRLVLEGREEQDEGSGKNRRTNTDVFYTADIAHFTNVNDIKTGHVLCTIPTGHAPSDSDGRHRIVWVIRLKAQVEFGADLNDEYPLTIIAPVTNEVTTQ
jgi:hypothetical protein